MTFHFKCIDLLARGTHVILWLHKIFSCNYFPNSDKDQLNKIHLFFLILIVYIITAFSFSIMHIIRDNFSPATVLLTGVAVMLGTRIYLSITKQYRRAFTMARSMMILIY